MRSLVPRERNYFTSFQKAKFPHSTRSFACHTYDNSFSTLVLLCEDLIVKSLLKLCQFSDKRQRDGCVIFIASSSETTTMMTMPHLHQVSESQQLVKFAAEWCLPLYTIYNDVMSMKVWKVKVAHRVSKFTIPSTDPP